MQQNKTTTLVGHPILCLLRTSSNFHAVHVPNKIRVKSKVGAFQLIYKCWLILWRRQLDMIIWVFCSHDNESDQRKMMPTTTTTSRETRVSTNKTKDRPIYLWQGTICSPSIHLLLCPTFTKLSLYCFPSLSPIQIYPICILICCQEHLSAYLLCSVYNLTKWNLVGTMSRDWCSTPKCDPHRFVLSKCMHCLQNKLCLRVSSSWPC